MQQLPENFRNIYHSVLVNISSIPEDIDEQETCKLKTKVAAMKLFIYLLEYSMLPLCLAMAKLVSPSSAAATAATLPAFHTTTYFMLLLEQRCRYGTGNVDNLYPVNPSQHQSTSPFYICIETLAPLIVMLMSLFLIDKKDPIKDHLSQQAMLIQFLAQALVSTTIYTFKLQIYETDYQPKRCRIDFFTSNSKKLSEPLYTTDQDQTKKEDLDGEKCSC